MTNSSDYPRYGDGLTLSLGKGQSLRLTFPNGHHIDLRVNTQGGRDTDHYCEECNALAPRVGRTVNDTVISTLLELVERQAARFHSEPHHGKVGSKSTPIQYSIDAALAAGLSITRPPGPKATLTAADLAEPDDLSWLTDPMPEAAAKRPSQTTPKPRRSALTLQDEHQRNIDALQTDAQRAALSSARRKRKSRSLGK